MVDKKKDNKIEFDFNDLPNRFVIDLRKAKAKINNKQVLNDKDVSVVNSYYFMKANFEHAQELQEELFSTIKNNVKKTSPFEHDEKTKEDDYFCFYDELRSKNNWSFDKLEIMDRKFYLLNPGIKSIERTAEKLSKEPTGQKGTGAAYDYNHNLLSDVTRSSIICEDMMDLELIS